MGPEHSHWWETRRAALLFVLATMIPLLWPTVPPLVDLPGHIGRYHIALDAAGPHALAKYFGYHWQVIGNLGVDLLVMPLAPLFGVELAAKAIVIAIPVLTVAGMLWLAYETHGRIPATALFALPLAYNFPFQFGFVNYCLAMALMLLALALWIRLGRTGPLWLRTVIFVPLSCVLWIAHVFGWACFGLFAGGAELARQRAAGRSWFGTGWRAALICAPLATPVLFMIGNGPITTPGDWFQWGLKALWLASLLRDRWQPFDFASVAVLVAAFYVAMRTRCGMSPTLGWPAAFGAISFVLLPRLMMGGAYVDMRLIPYVVALALLAIRPGRSLAMANAGALFFAVRMAASCWSFILHDAEMEPDRAALTVIPQGATVLALVERPCGIGWNMARDVHLPSLAIIRRNAFVNDQWTLAGQQLVQVRSPYVEPYASDPSQQSFPASCGDVGSNFDQAIASFDRRGFAYVWTIGFPLGRAHAGDLKPVWHNSRSALYRVLPPAPSRR